MKQTAITASLVCLAAAASLGVGGSSAFAQETGQINIPAATCIADSPLDGAGGNIVINGINARITFTTAPSGVVNATCHFEDISGVFETKAEQQKIDVCTIILPTGPVVVGTGHVVASSEKANKPVGDGTGGHATLKCKGQLP